MTNNQENNDSETYVMADEPIVSPPPFPWWLILLPLFLIGGAIAFVVNKNQPKLATKPEIPVLPSNGENNTENSGQELSSNGDNNTENSEQELSFNRDNNTENSEQELLPNGDNSTENSSQELSSNRDNSTGNFEQELLPNGDNSTESSRSVSSSNGTSETEFTEFRETLYFAYKETDVSASDISKLESFLSQLPETTGTLTIEGHSDAIGSDEYNYDLAKKRAEQVISKLQEMGLEEQYQVKIQSWGETKPARDNSTDEGRALNRRVVLSFSNQN